MSIPWPSPHKVAVLTTVQGDFVAVVAGDDAYVEQVRAKIEESLDGIRIFVAPERGSYYWQPAIVISIPNLFGKKAP